ncbi:MAG: 3-deoxy-manno-octulosonate cytidylyltransferase [Pseudomonadota bacterium]|nr:3-deoxy-manno-octulosonate cytidylyltransferase [Pseudomonadota bacterium]
MAKIIGVVPARMAASRFPGKPLYPIKGIPLVEHCFLRASLYNRWTQLVLATCDREIEQFANDKGMPVTMTSDSHTRALDRVAEAAQLIDPHLNATDIVVCVQGDEPLLGPDMLEVVVNPILNDQGIEGTMLAIPILNRETFLNRDIVKIVHDKNGDVLYTSRAPIPHCEVFSPELGAKRVGGIFAFQWGFLKWFTNTPEAPLEKFEQCDSNRICNNGRKQRIALGPSRPYISVDSPQDVSLVEEAIIDDMYYGRY